MVEGAPDAVLIRLGEEKEQLQADLANNKSELDGELAKSNEALRLEQEAKAALQAELQNMETEMVNAKEALKAEQEAEAALEV